MSKLKIYHETNPRVVELSTELPLEVEQVLMDYNIIYQQGFFDEPATSIIEDEDLQIELKRDLMPLEIQHKFPFCQAVVLDDSYPDYERLRLKYLSEHEYDREESFIFVDGLASFFFHVGDKVIQLICERGDFLLIPAHQAHWVDYGLNPNVSAVRCTQVEEEQVINYTGNHISDMFPRLG